MTGLTLTTMPDELKPPKAELKPAAELLQVFQLTTICLTAKRMLLMSLTI